MGNYCGCIKSSFSEYIRGIINNLDTLSDNQKKIIEYRFVKIVCNIELQMKRTAFLYNVLSLFTTVGSILVPALISIQDKPSDIDATQEEVDEHNNRIYWAGWGVSLLVTISNGIIKLFSIDKTYITRHLRYNDFKKEGWLFLQLAGHYKDFRTHSEAFSTFSYNIEMIKYNQIHEEFVPENNTEVSISVNNPNTNPEANPNTNPEANTSDV